MVQPLSRVPLPARNVADSYAKFRKILVFGDSHMATGAARQIPGSAQADLVILSDDPTNCGGVTEVKAVLDDILAVAKGRALPADTPNPGMRRGGGWVTVSINPSQLEIHLQ